MKITKYPQSCIMIETKSIRILVDPGVIDFKEEYVEEWKHADYILITHKHPDHCHAEIIKDFDADIFSTNEVQKEYPMLAINIVEADCDMLELGEIAVEVAEARHGYIPWLKGGKEIYENVGYIIDDGENRLYVTSDTISFANEYKCDILCASVSGHGLVMGPFEVALYAKESGAKLVIPVHMDNPKFPVDVDKIKKTFEEFDVIYKILSNGESINI